MRYRIVRVLKMAFGLFFCALGIVVKIKANIGYAPWDVFNVGLSKTFGFSIGFSNTLVGIVIVIIVLFFRERIGFGTVSNMLFIGIIIDIILHANIIKTPNNPIFNYLMLIIGLFITSIGTYLYISSAFGAGPRDSLMVILTKKTKIPVGVCRSIIELIVTIVGGLLGGMVGIGTIISVVGLGFCIQVTFKIFRFDVKSIKHESFYDTLRDKRK